MPKIDLNKIIEERDYEGLAEILQERSVLQECFYIIPVGNNGVKQSIGPISYLIYQGRFEEAEWLMKAMRDVMIEVWGETPTASCFTQDKSIGYILRGDVENTLGDIYHDHSRAMEIAGSIADPQVVEQLFKKISEKGIYLRRIALGAAQAGNTELCMRCIATTGEGIIDLDSLNPSLYFITSVARHRGYLGLCKQLLAFCKVPKNIAIVATEANILPDDSQITQQNVEELIKYAIIEKNYLLINQCHRLFPDKVSKLGVEIFQCLLGYFYLEHLKKDLAYLDDPQFRATILVHAKKYLTNSPKDTRKYAEQRLKQIPEILQQAGKLNFYIRCGLSYEQACLCVEDPSILSFARTTHFDRSSTPGLPKLGSELHVHILKFLLGVKQDEEMHNLYNQLIVNSTVLMEQRHQQLHHSKGKQGSTPSSTISQNIAKFGFIQGTTNLGLNKEVLAKNYPSDSGWYYGEGDTFWTQAIGASKQTELQELATKMQADGLNARYELLSENLGRIIVSSEPLVTVDVACKK